MNDHLHLSTQHHQILEALIRQHLPGIEVWAYGSRVNGRSHDGSDLDLVLRAPGLEKVPTDQLSDFEDALRESSIPFLVEARDWARLPGRFHREIERDHVVFDAVESFNTGGPSSIRQHGWTQLILGRTCTKIGSGATPRGGKEVYLPSGPYALIRSQNVFNDGFQVEGLAHIGQLEASKLSNVDVAKDDVLLNITGDSVARVCQVRPDILPARVNQHVSIIRPDPVRLDPRFLRYALAAPDMQAKLLSWAGSGGTRNALTKGMIESLDVAAPRFVYEQHAIAHILGTLDDKIDLNRRMNEILETMARAIFKDWFVDFGPTRAKAEGRAPYLAPELWELFPDALDDSDKPSGWRNGKLNDLIVLQRGFDLPKPKRVKGKFPILAASGVNGTHNEAKVPGPGVTTGRSGVIGKAFYVHEDFWPLNTSLWVKQYRNSSPAHAYFLIQTLDFASFNSGSVVPTLNRNHVHDLPMAVPRPETIQGFDSFIGPLLQRQRLNDVENIALACTRDYLLPKLMSGEVRLRDAEQIVEAVA